jgi:hypothetical protein
MEAFIVVDGYAEEYIRKHKGDPSDQEYLLSLISVETDKKMLLAALKLVSHSKLDEKQDVLIGMLSHKNPQVRVLSLSRLAATLQREGTPIYVEKALENPKFRDKHNAVHQICKYGDERAVTAMIKRLRNILNTRKGTPYLRKLQESELTDVIGFLDKYAEDGAVRKVFDRVLDKVDIFVDAEKEFVVNNFSYFANRSDVAG